MKCYEVVRCSEQERAKCYVWNAFRDHPEDFEQIKCWVIKNVSQPENRDLLQKCLKCSYYLMMNRDTTVVADFSADVAMISCDGVLNAEKTRVLVEVWEKLKKGGKRNVLLNLAKVGNIYSCGLGALVKMHKEAADAGGALVVIAGQGYVKLMLDSTKLVRILHLAADHNEARKIFGALKQKQERAAAALAAPAAPLPPPPKKRIPCWEYFKNHNPRNATRCDECFKKINPSAEPCWIVEGIIEGVSFQYVNEGCETCAYFLEYHNAEAPARPVT